ncbi:ABC transporter ATP-binding protein [Streptomyces armeniacus]|uniref:ABC transporter ATP-binding protein n=1 Tax=Streptomyces armeniacus TaxID=83291 RepID=A0A345XM26_9ACTN|nr:ABC transporter ATP-binding protein [Streptomyces armeniacus]AXK32692.1 ABC transporter ATP-binding protein [Streptomyces armeniacus]
MTRDVPSGTAPRRPRGGGGLHRKPTGTARTLLRPVFSAHRPTLVRLFLWSLLGTVPVLLSGQLVAASLDHGFLRDDAAVGFGALGCYGLVMVGGAFGSRQAVPHMARVTEAVRDHLVRVSVRGSILQAVAAGQQPRTSAVSRITDQTERARQLLANLLMTASTSGFTFGAAIVGLSTLAPVVGLLLVPVALVAAVALVRLSLAWRRRYSRSLDTEERLADEAGRVVGGIRDVVACAATGRAAGDLEERLRTNAEAAASVGVVGGARNGVIAFTARMPLMLLLALAPWLVSSGALSPGQLVGAATYLITSLEPALRVLVQSIGNLGLELATVLRRLSAFGQVPVLAAGGTAAPEAARGADLDLHRVTFRYGPHSEPVLHDASFRIESGEHLVIVGPSGIGKSTLVNVLSGLESPESGAVRLAGTDLGELSTDWLRRTVALVPQEAYVFAGTLRENLTYLRPDADQRRLDHVVRVLGLGELVRRHGGYDGEPLHPGALSEGQRQLITLARVHLSPARVVILDEATCHLDPVTEERVEHAFRRREGTLIVIAHRISSALRARRILVLDTGGLHSGTHDGLVRDSSTYANLVGHWNGDGGDGA